MANAVWSKFGLNRDVNKTPPLYPKGGANYCPKNSKQFKSGLFWYCSKSPARGFMTPDMDPAGSSPSFQASSSIGF